MMTYRVMLLCNDHHGMFTERVESVEVGDEIRLVCQRQRPPTMRFRETMPATVKVGRRNYQHRNHWTCVGNVYWDAVSMETDVARALVRDLLADGWTVEEHADDGPFADLVMP